MQSSPWGKSSIGEDVITPAAYLTLLRLILRLFLHLLLCRLLCLLYQLILSGIILCHENLPESKMPSR